MGAFAGILMTYLIFNEPVQGYLLWPNERIQGSVGATRYFSEFGNIFYAKILWLEMLNSFVLVYAYLLMIYRPALRTVDEIIKGIGFALVLYACLATTAESGGCLNPALAISQVSYQVGFLNGFDLNGGRYASPIWCYIVFPLVGAVFAAIFFRMHIKLDNRALKQAEEPPVV